MIDPVGKLLQRWRIRAVLPHVAGRLLDLGCGTNALVRRYPGDGVGVDVHPWEGVDLVVEDTARLPFDPGSFDTVTIVAALNHIPNREDVLAECRRLLADGGRLIVTMIPPGLSRVWHRLRSPFDPDQRERGMRDGEVYGLSDADMRRLLADAGFRVVLHKRFMLGINRLTVAEKAESDTPTA